MVKNLLLFLLSFLTFAAYGQEYAALYNRSNGSKSVVNYNLNSNSPADVLKDLGSINYQKNTFTLLENGSSYAYVTKTDWNSEIHIHDFDGNSKSVVLKNRRVLSVDYFDDMDRLVVLATRRTPNYYSFLEEDVSVIILDEVGAEDISIDIPLASVFVDELPYYGISKRVDGFGANQSIEYGMSLPTALQSEGRLVFMARDIMGVPRLYTVNVRKKKVEFNTVLDHHVLSLCPSKEDGIVKALCYNPSESIDGKMDVKVADISIHNGRMTNMQSVTKINAYNPSNAIKDGCLTLDLESSQVIASKINGSAKVMVLDLESNEVKETKNGNQNVDISTWNATESGGLALSQNVNVYPNPNNGQFTITTTELLKMDGLKVYDMVGNLIKDFKVTSNSVSNNFDLSYLSKGFYMLSIEAQGQSFLYKITKY